MVARLVHSRDVKCYLCGGVTGRLVRAAAALPGVRPRLILNPNLPTGPRFANNRLVCAFCGGSLYLDSTDEQLVETQKIYPRERRGRPPGRGRRRAEAGA